MHENAGNTLLRISKSTRFLLKFRKKKEARPVLNSETLQAHSNKVKQRQALLIFLHNHEHLLRNKTTETVNPVRSSVNSHTHTQNWLKQNTTGLIDFVATKTRGGPVKGTPSISEMPSHQH